MTPAPGSPEPTDALPALKQAVAGVVLRDGHIHFEQPVQLASGAWSHDFIDAKRALARGDDLRLACEAILVLAAANGWAFDAVGGLTLGADQFAHGIAVVSGTSWFVVRKAAKDRGTRRRIEGAALGPGVAALLVEDVVTTGGSILEACDEVEATGARVAAAVSLVDRGDLTKSRFAERGVPYAALLTYRDLGLEPVGPERGEAQAAG